VSHTYTDIVLHIVFSTKERRRFHLDKMSRLRAYLGGMVKKNDATLLSIGGTEDHVHLLVAVPTTIPLAKFVQLIKGSSSKWFNEQFLQERFAWQEGFSAFSVSRSQVDAVLRYVQNQEEHHRKRDFAEEYKTLLRLHHVTFDPRYVLG
jgi:REP element-mobilizing transposase RayT